ncbi:MAG TPA: tetratricopeptide repeat protein [Bryobacteraceae bacterium]|nr:tetratricopeptide repeat protein [Bryobacteraceae bacterium]
MKDRLSLLVEQAQAAERHDRLDDAIRLYREVLRLRPHWPAAEMNLGLVYFSQKNYVGAIEQLSDALRHNPALDSAYLFRGAAYSIGGEREKAIRDLNRYLLHDRASMEALAYLAGAYYDANDFAHAALQYAEQIRIAPSENLWFQLGDCYLQMARFSMTRLSEDPQAKYYFLLLSAEELLPGDKRELAEEQVREAIRLDPQAPEAAAVLRRIAGETKQDCKEPRDPQLVRANCLAQSGDFAAATQALVVQPSPKATYWSFRIAKRLAQSAMEKLAPDSPLLALLRAQIFEQNGQDEEADKQYRMAMLGVESLIRYGKFQCKRSQFNEGLDLYNRALALEPGNPRILALIGEVYATEGQPEKALSYLRDALATAPRDIKSRIYLAQCLGRMDRAAEAIAQLEAAPEDPDGRIHYVLGTLYQQGGNSEKARRAMDIFRQRKKR